MKFVLQPLTIHITNCDAKSRMMRGSVEKRKHGEMLPSTIRVIICGPSNCKTNVLISLLESPNGVHFENVYVYSKSLQQPKYRYLENLFTSIDEIGYFLQQQRCHSTERGASKFYFYLWWRSMRQAGCGERILSDGPPREHWLLLSLSDIREDS